MPLRIPQMSLEEQRALFVNHSASFALTPEEQARSKQQASKQARDRKVSEPKEGDTTAGDNKDVDDKPMPVAIKTKNRPHQLVSLLD
jgi:hypothetical protein